MNHQITQILADLSENYVKDWQKTYKSLPVANDMAGLASVCAQGRNSDDDFTWLPQQREEQADFSKLERGIELELHSDIKDFYGAQFSADLTLTWQKKPFTLLQVWSDEDFINLQENILGHLVTQRRLKRKPTVFIGTLEAELDVISICNITGAVLLESLGTGEREELSPSIEAFLKDCEPAV